jgi:hypothetical protein
MTRDEALQRALETYNEAAADRTGVNVSLMMADGALPEQIADFLELSRDIEAQGREDFIAFTLGVLDAEAG